VFPIFLFLPTYPSNLALTMIIQIKMKSNAHPTRYTPTGLEFSDGTELPADVIVFTTGFVGNMRHNVSALVSPEVESQLEDLWGLDAEGELLGAFKYSGRELFLSFYSLSFRLDFRWLVTDALPRSLSMELDGPTITMLARCYSLSLCTILAKTLTYRVFFPCV
jgi:hypothetical protein